MLADGYDLIRHGFALLATLDYPHWTVVVPEPATRHFTLVRACFSQPVPNPTFRRNEG